MRKPIAVLIGTLSIITAGCGGGGDTSTGPPSVAGTYTLQTVNNSSLPFTTSEDETYKAEILSWLITLKDDNTYSDVFQGRSTDHGQATENTLTSSGTFTLTGSTLKLFDPVENSNLEATVQGSTMTVVIDGPMGTFNLKFKR
jgi:hypothetical protein